ncbi:YeiH family protein [Erythrobacter sp. JK5]|uniref:YeiH family protein n=1 Tax=Erythrobacter sp. JK5 TaxID=2829500 RepID=UPI001BA64FBA|nr:putative sulfate exporter family transporter [Erythrobacter sp. JK5]QUL36998.1 putative sulfate exporter family transporter [Erythrobacter sp. JK5]
MTVQRPDPALYAGDLFGEYYQAERPTAVRRVSLRELVPGLLTCLIAALASLWLAEHYGFPAILLGLLIGLALNFLAQLGALEAGLDFAARHFLRLGIVLLGLQLTVMDVSGLGWMPFAGLVLIMGSAFAAGIVGARLSGQGRYAGALAGGATAICGASAALALYAVIGQDRLDQARFTITLVGVALASAFALSLYPVIAGALELTDAQAGYLVGASIHDVAQAIGGGYAISENAGEQATIIKLTRVALLAPVVALVAVWLGDASQSPGDASRTLRPIWRRLSLPWFILAFLATVAVSSVVAVPPDIAEGGLEASKFLLLLAVIATAMRSRLSLLIEAGWRPLVPVFSATFVSFLAALAAAILLID